MVYKPIQKNISCVKDELKNFVAQRDTAVRDVFSHFLDKPGKLFRPALVFFTAGAINSELPKSDDKNLVQLAFALELLHSASLVHDDIIDGDLTRRGQKTLNKVFNNKIAVLAGDVLFSKSFSIFGTLFAKDYIETVTDLTMRMCTSEILQTKANPTCDEYFKILVGKTALFVSVCCKLGAKYAGGTDEQVKILEDFGMNFGLAYQIKDDLVDGDINAKKYVTFDDVTDYFTKAKDCLMQLDKNRYREDLLSLINFFLKETYQ